MYDEAHSGTWFRERLCPNFIPNFGRYGYGRKMFQGVRGSPAAASRGRLTLQAVSQSHSREKEMRSRFQVMHRVSHSCAAVELVGKGGRLLGGEVHGCRWKQSDGSSRGRVAATKSHWRRPQGTVLQPTLIDDVH